MLEICPNGTFTPTFYSPKTLRTPEDFEKYYESDKHAFKDKDGQYRSGMYFNFKRDYDGERLLKKLLPKSEIKPRGYFFKKNFNIIKD